MDQEKEENPIAEIFDEVFTLMEDLETRSVAILEYMKEQGGVSDEKLAPYLDRAAAASDVRWRAARARMEHLLAPKPKSATEVRKDETTKEESQSQAQAKKNEAKSGGTKPQGEKQTTEDDSKALGNELASARLGAQDSTEPKEGKSQNAKPAENAKSDQKKPEGGQQGKEAETTSKDTESQAAALAGQKNSDTPKPDRARSQAPQTAGERSTSQPSDEEKQQTQKAAK